MRESYFSADIDAIVDALRDRESRSAQLDAELGEIQSELTLLLDDRETPEREWRHLMAAPLHSLARLMQDIGTPTLSVETLAAELRT